jgi:hypothetical protein
VLASGDGPDWINKTAFAVEAVVHGAYLSGLREGRRVAAHGS